MTFLQLYKFYLKISFGEIVQNIAHFSKDYNRLKLPSHRFGIALAASVISLRTPSCLTLFVAGVILV